MGERREMDGADLRRGMVPRPLLCIECGLESDATAWRWRSYRTDDPTENEEPALAFFCPDCAAREFGVDGPDSEQSNLQF